MSNILTIIFGIIGALFSVYFGVENRKLNKSRVTFTWNDVQNGARDLVQQLKQSKFKPSVILSLSTRGAIMANVISTDLGYQTPIYLCIQEDKRLKAFDLPPQDHDVIETSKWNLYFPSLLRKHKDDKILIVDDIVISGDGLTSTKSLLKEMGFKSQNIKSATLFCTQSAKDGGKASDFFWFETQNSRLYFPWGKSR